ncbi:MAG: hypothetical protein HQK94_19290 [Nitrospirae bacterium]|nr:hypothetical protein [Nitrospirota bacterium]
MAEVKVHEMSYEKIIWQPTDSKNNTVWTVMKRLPENKCSTETIRANLGSEIMDVSKIGSWGKLIANELEKDKQ